MTKLEPTMPKINDVYKKQINREFSSDEIELPQLNTIIHSKKSRPMVIQTRDVNIPKIPDVDDEYRKILLGNDPEFKDFNFSKLSATRHGKNNETYDLPYIKKLAKRLKVSSKDNKDDIIIRIEDKARSLGFDIK